MPVSSPPAPPSGPARKVTRSAGAARRNERSMARPGLTPIQRSSVSAAPTREAPGKAASPTARPAITLPASEGTGAGPAAPRCEPRGADPERSHRAGDQRRARQPEAGDAQPDAGRRGRLAPHLDPRSDQRAGEQAHHRPHGEDHGVVGRRGALEERGARHGAHPVSQGAEQAAPGHHHQGQRRPQVEDRLHRPRPDALVQPQPGHDLVAGPRDRQGLGQALEGGEDRDVEEGHPLFVALPGPGEALGCH